MINLSMDQNTMETKIFILKTFQVIKKITCTKITILQQQITQIINT